MAQTYKEIMLQCLAEALGLPPNAADLQDETRYVALGIMNEQAEIIWLSWKWDNEKMDEFDSPTPDANGVITFDETVETILAVRAVEAGETEGGRIWNQDELLAASQGRRLDSDRFLHLAADADLNRRIMVYPADDGVTYPAYKVLALRKYAPAIVDANYSESTPTITPTDYRVMVFPLDRATSAFRANVKDGLRVWQQVPTQGAGNSLMKLAHDREQVQADRERRLVPKCPMFDEVGGWR